jgi:hypothetical protein
MTILRPDAPKTTTEILALLRSCQGEAETRRQLALLSQAGRPAGTRREG